MGPQEDFIETVVTCEGDFYDPEFHSQLHDLKQGLQDLIGKETLIVKKVEPWNSVRVTFNIPKEAAVRLKQLAEQGNQALRQLGVLAVQIEGDRHISLTIAGKNNETTEVVFQTVPSSSSSAAAVIAAPGSGTASSIFDLRTSEFDLTVPLNVSSSQRNINYLPEPTHSGPSLLEPIFNPTGSQQLHRSSGTDAKSRNNGAPPPFDEIGGMAPAFGVASPSRSPATLGMVSQAMAGRGPVPGRSPPSHPQLPVSLQQQPVSHPQLLQHTSNQSPISPHQYPTPPPSVSNPSSPSLRQVPSSFGVSFPHAAQAVNNMQNRLVTSNKDITSSSPLLVNLLQSDVGGHINNLQQQKIPSSLSFDGIGAPAKKKRRVKKPKNDNKNKMPPGLIQPSAASAGSMSLDVDMSTSASISTSAASHENHSVFPHNAGNSAVFPNMLNTTTTAEDVVNTVLSKSPLTSSSPLPQTLPSQQKSPVAKQHAQHMINPYTGQLELVGNCESSNDSSSSVSRSLSTTIDQKVDESPAQNALGMLHPPSNPLVDLQNKMSDSHGIKSTKWQSRSSPSSTTSVSTASVTRSAHTSAITCDTNMSSSSVSSPLLSSSLHPVSTVASSLSHDKPGSRRNSVSFGQRGSPSSHVGVVSSVTSGSSTVNITTCTAHANTNTSSSLPNVISSTHSIRVPDVSLNQAECTRTVSSLRNTSSTGQDSSKVLVPTLSSSVPVMSAYSVSHSTSSFPSTSSHSLRVPPTCPSAMFASPSPLARLQGHVLGSILPLSGMAKAVSSSCSTAITMSTTPRVSPSHISLSSYQAASTIPSSSSITEAASGEITGQSAHNVSKTTTMMDISMAKDALLSSSKDNGPSVCSSSISLPHKPLPSWHLQSETPARSSVECAGMLGSSGLVASKGGAHPYSLSEVNVQSRTEVRSPKPLDINFAQNLPADNKPLHASAHSLRHLQNDHHAALPKSNSFESDTVSNGSPVSAALHHNPNLTNHTNLSVSCENHSSPSALSPTVTSTTIVLKNSHPLSSDSVNVTNNGASKSEESPSSGSDSGIASQIASKNDGSAINHDSELSSQSSDEHGSTMTESPDILSKVNNSDQSPLTCVIATVNDSSSASIEKGNWCLMDKPSTLADHSSYANKGLLSKDNAPMEHGLISLDNSVSGNVVASGSAKAAVPYHISFKQSKKVISSKSPADNNHSSNIINGECHSADTLDSGKLTMPVSQCSEFSSAPCNLLQDAASAKTQDCKESCDSGLESSPMLPTVKDASNDSSGIRETPTPTSVMDTGSDHLTLDKRSGENSPQSNDQSSVSLVESCPVVVQDTVNEPTAADPPEAPRPLQDIASCQSINEGNDTIIATRGDSMPEDTAKSDEHDAIGADARVDTKNSEYNEGVKNDENNAEDAAQSSQLPCERNEGINVNQNSEAPAGLEHEDETSQQQTSESLSNKFDEANSEKSPHVECITASNTSTLLTCESAVSVTETTETTTAISEVCHDQSECQPLDSVVSADAAEVNLISDKVGDVHCNTVIDSKGLTEPDAEGKKPQLFETFSSDQPGELVGKEAAVQNQEITDKANSQLNISTPPSSLSVVDKLSDDGTSECSGTTSSEPIQTNSKMPLSEAVEPTSLVIQATSKSSPDLNSAVFPKSVVRSKSPAKKIAAHKMNNKKDIFKPLNDHNNHIVGNAAALQRSVGEQLTKQLTSAINPGQETFTSNGPWKNIHHLMKDSEVVTSESEPGLNMKHNESSKHTPSISIKDVTPDAKVSAELTDQIVMKGINKTMQVQDLVQKTVNYNHKDKLDDGKAEVLSDDSENDSKGISILKPLKDREVEVQEVELVTTPDMKRVKKSTAKVTQADRKDLVSLANPKTEIVVTSSTATKKSMVPIEADKPKKEALLKGRDTPPGDELISCQRDTGVVQQRTRGLKGVGLGKTQTITVTSAIELTNQSDPTHLSRFVQKSLNTPTLLHTTHAIMAPGFTDNLTESVQKVMMSLPNMDTTPPNSPGYTRVAQPTLETIATSTENRHFSAKVIKNLSYGCETISTGAVEVSVTAARSSCAEVNAEDVCTPVLSVSTNNEQNVHLDCLSPSSNDSFVSEHSYSARMPGVSPLKTSPPFLPSVGMKPSAPAKHNLDITSAQVLKKLFVSQPIEKVKSIKRKLSTSESNDPSDKPDLKAAKRPRSLSTDSSLSSFSQPNPLNCSYPLPSVESPVSLPKNESIESDAGDHRATPMNEHSQKFGRGFRRGSDGLTDSVLTQSSADTKPVTDWSSGSTERCLSPIQSERMATRSSGRRRVSPGLCSLDSLADDQTKGPRPGKRKLVSPIEDADMKDDVSTAVPEQSVSEDSVNCLTVSDLKEGSLKASSGLKVTPDNDNNGSLKPSSKKNQIKSEGNIKPSTVRTMIKNTKPAEDVMTEEDGSVVVRTSSSPEPDRSLSPSTAVAKRYIRSCRSLKVDPGDTQASSKRRKASRENRT